MKTLVLALAVLCFATSRADDNWKKYPYYPPHGMMQFPFDEGAHPIISALEWWYVVMHVKGDTTGDDYSILVTHFNNQYRFFTVTDTTKGIHESGTTRGPIQSKIGYMDVTQRTQYGTDFFRTRRDEKKELIPFEYELHTYHDKMELQAELKAQKAPAMIGGNGFVTIGSSGFSWYYSQTRLAARGAITLNGVTETFTGLGWMDHQWGPFLISPVELNRFFETYEWFCVQLDNGTELMISNIYNRLHQLPQLPMYGGVGIFNPDGSMDGVVKKQFTRVGYWQDPVSQSYMSMGWNLKVPEWDLDLTLTPKMKNQMVQFPLGGSFWEGSASVTGTQKGVAVKGQAFGELMHHFELPKILLSGLRKTYHPHDVIKIRWHIFNPDEGNPLSFDVELVDKRGATPIATNVQGESYEFRPEQLATFQMGQYLLRVTAHSRDGVIASSKDSQEFTLTGL